ncbi:MAG: 3-methyl-2-oxobutanoate hydroxymethyltransferase [Bdellovibrionales bacterium]|nr:3-methyl-2-oxobutanoate hydroxymethyltransferase [Bdellovibrionales bacterium]
MASKPSQGRITVPSIAHRKPSLGLGSRIVALTAYDYSFARLIDSSEEVDIVLVGDSLGSVIQGHDTTLPVTLDEMIYHCKAVVRGTSHALVVGDLPFLSYQTSPEQAIESAGRLLKEGGVSAVKLEGGVYMEETISRLCRVDIPVMGHVGLTPQSYHRMGGHKVQGRGVGNSANASSLSAQRVLEDAHAVEQAGAFAIVLEGIPEELAEEVTSQLSIPTIGIGAGVHCDGQILVTHDMLGLSMNFSPKFVKRYAELGEQLHQAVCDYATDVKGGDFPASEHSFSEMRGAQVKQKTRLEMV